MRGSSRSLGNGRGGRLGGWRTEYGIWVFKTWKSKHRIRSATSGQSNTLVVMNTSLHGEEMLENASGMWWVGRVLS
jgi:hypothetical protein